MTRAYILDPITRDIQGLVDQSWEQLKYTRRYWGMDTFEMSIQRARLWASTIQKGRLLYLPDEGDRIFLIEQINSVAEGSARNDLMTVAGRSLEGIAMAERLVIPPAGQDYDRVSATPGETAMKHYVTDHASSTATDVNRRLPGLVCIASAGTGANVTVSGRYQYVFDLVKQIGLLTGQGWEILYNPTLDRFEFDVINGVDRSADVFFDFAFETLERWEELDSIADSKTTAVVAGQGEGADREVVVRGSAATGFERREAFIDARDIELGQTGELTARGDAFLAAASAELRLEAGIHQYGSFRYGQHWDMGDLVLVRNEERGISYTARVVEVSKAFTTSAAAPVVTAIIDRPFPTLKEQVQGAGAGAGAQDSVAGDVDFARMRLTATDDVSLASTLHAFQIGPDNGANLAIDVNEIMARSNGAGADLHLNADAGKVIVGQNVSAAELQIGSDISLLRIGANILAVGAGDRLRVKPSATTDVSFDVHVGAEAATRLVILGDGELQWGDGTLSKDVNLYRDQANILRTDDDFIVGNPAGGTGFQLRASGGMEIAGTTPYIDFKNAGGDDFDARFILTGNDQVDFQGANIQFEGDVDILGDLTLASIEGSTVSSGSGSVTIAGDGTATFSTQTFEWVKIGRVVIFTFAVAVSANGSGTSTVTFSFSGAPLPMSTSRVWFDRGGTGVQPIVARFLNSGGSPQFSSMNRLSVGASYTDQTSITGADLANGATYQGTFAYMASA